MRINRYLARCGVASRRKAETLVRDGRVTKNGEIVRELSTTVEEADRICVDGEMVSLLSERLLLAYHKPRGLVCSHHDTFGAPLIYEQLPQNKGLFSIGRLDRDSEGLLLITNDGNLGHRVAHPSTETEKEYITVLDRPFTITDAETLTRGIQVDGTLMRMDAVQYYVANANDALWERVLPAWPPSVAPSCVVRVVLHEGHKREIRRLFRALHYRVRRLIRVRIGRIILGDLLPGAYRPLDGKEEI